MNTPLAVTALGDVACAVSAAMSRARKVPIRYSQESAGQTCVQSGGLRLSRTTGNDRGSLRVTDQETGEEGCNNYLRTNLAYRLAVWWGHFTTGERS